MSKVFFIADTHFGHEKAAMWRGFKDVDEHDTYLREAWNATVSPKDTVWHLGDVAFSSREHMVAQLNGYKRLVMGNHEHKHSDVYAELFDRLYGVAEYKGCLLTHIPVHVSQKTRYPGGNIHGHLHSNKVRHPNEAADTWYTCVSCEQTDFKPQTFDQLQNRRLAHVKNRP